MKIKFPFVGEGPTAWWEWLLSPIALPIIFVVLAVAGILSVPACWLYPEWLTSWIDFDGTPEQQARLHEYRTYRSRIGFWRRVLEKLHLVTVDNPPCGSYEEVVRWPTGVLEGGARRTVRITGGAFVGQIGCIDRVDVTRRCAIVVLVNHGRSTPVEVDIEEIEPA